MSGFFFDPINLTILKQSHERINHDFYAAKPKILNSLINIAQQSFTVL